MAEVSGNMALNAARQTLSVASRTRRPGVPTMVILSPGRYILHGPLTWVGSPSRLRGSWTSTTVKIVLYMGEKMAGTAKRCSRGQGRWAPLAHNRLVIMVFWVFLSAPRGGLFLLRRNKGKRLECSSSPRRGSALCEAELPQLEGVDDHYDAAGGHEEGPPLGPEGDAPGGQDARGHGDGHRVVACGPGQVLPHLPHGGLAEPYEAGHVAGAVPDEDDVRGLPGHGLRGPPVVAREHDDLLAHPAKARYGGGGVVLESVREAYDPLHLVPHGDEAERPALVVEPLRPLHEPPAVRLSLHLHEAECARRHTHAPHHPLHTVAGHGLEAARRRGRYAPVLEGSGQRHAYGVLGLGLQGRRDPQELVLLHAVGDYVRDLEAALREGAGLVEDDDCHLLPDLKGLGVPDH